MATDVRHGIDVTNEHRSETSLQFERQWATLRNGDELVPLYSAFDPLDFAEYLSLLVIAEIDLEKQTMPIRLAGNTIRDFVGFELTGKDFLDYDNSENSEISWRHRMSYHDCPCGRFELVDVRYGSGLYMECALTILPLAGNNHERMIVILAEPLAPQAFIPEKETATVAEAAKFGDYIDIGAGVLPPN